MSDPSLPALSRFGGKRVITLKQGQDGITKAGMKAGTKCDIK